MTTREALLAAIIAHPDEDTPRLAYADFLDESGDPSDAARATLIRTQIAAARLKPEDPSRAELDRLAKDLWNRHQGVWFEGVDPKKLPFPSRGFITHWGCYSTDDLASAQRTALAREPITDLTLSLRGAEQLAVAADWPELARVRELKVWPGSADDEGLVSFFRSSYLTALRKVDIMGNRQRPWGVMPETARALATLSQYRSLRELKVQHADVGDTGAVALANSASLGLTTLALCQCDIGISGLRALVASPVMSGIRHLALGGHAHTATDGEALAEALASSQYLLQLESLWLDETAFTDRAAALLARARWPSLKHLAIFPHAWSHSDEVTGLATMTARGVDSLVTWAPDLETLELDGQPIGDPGAEVLARGKRLSRLNRLSLINVGLTAGGVQELTAAYSRQLHYFQVARNNLGDAGAAVIAGGVWSAMIPAGQLAADEEPVPFFYEQRGLYLGQCGVGNAGVESLINSTTVPREIPDIFLGGSPASAAAVARLKAKYPNATVRY